MENKTKFIIGGLVGFIVLLLIVIAGMIFMMKGNDTDRKDNQQAITSPTPTPHGHEPGEDDGHPHTELDLTKLPLGDQKVSTTPKKGYIYSCQTTFNGGGANTAGPWINQQAKIWDLTKKVFVDGDKTWTGTWKISSNGTTRTLTGNGLPNHKTGIFPIATTDDAYKYDRNPNSISTQNTNYSLPTNPTLLTTPECAGGQVGIMLSGIPMFNGFDAGGRDAVAWEIQDKCGGHPQQSGVYHYHGPSSCIQDDSTANEHSDLVGYALDGFGIYGMKGENGLVLNSNDLDVCHGHTHKIMWDGQEKEMYHYHMTNDFPYSVGCFRGKSVRTQQQMGGQQPMPSTQVPGGNQGGPQRPPRQ